MGHRVASGRREFLHVVGLAQLTEAFRGAVVEWSRVGNGSARDAGTQEKPRPMAGGRKDERVWGMRRTVWLLISSVFNGGECEGSG
jgi:hypothetical protein